MLWLFVGIAIGVIFENPIKELVGKAWEALKAKLSKKA